MRCAIVIPARMGSSRFPGKPLVDLGGKPMIQWVAEAAEGSGVADMVVVATPDEEILTVCQRLGIAARMTSVAHQTGTDRIAELVPEIGAEVYVNVQGDEPLIRPESIAACAAPLLANASIEMGSLFSLCGNEEEDDPSVVKVVIDNRGFALYFSRFAVPYPRNARSRPLLKHVGIYAYRGETVQRFSHWPMGELERTESLEQLRFLENGVRIFMSEGQGSELAVDTPEQAERVRQVLAQRATK